MAKIIGPRGPIPVPDPPIVPPVIPANSKLKFPAGNVTTKNPQNGQPYNIPWSDISRWEPWISEAGEESPLTGAMLAAALMVVETQGNQYKNHGLTGTKADVITRIDNYPQDGPSVGLTQVKPKIWQPLLPDADAYIPKGNIRLGARVMNESIKKHGSWQKALVTDYFPDDDPNGTTQSAYVKTVESLLKELQAANQTPVPVPTPTPKHPLEVILGGAAWPAVDYGFGSDVGIDAYEFGVGHGNIRSTQHTGDDIKVPHGTRLFAPLPGKITCVGTRGLSTWGQGCGYYVDDMDGGIGNITLVTDAGLKIVFGHCHKSLVSSGDRVVAGQPIGISGGSNGDHLHLEVAINAPEKVSARNRAAGLTYWLLNPIPALKAAMGGSAPVEPVQPITDIIWEGTSNFHDRRGQVPVSIFYHITDDMNFSNVRSWFQNATSQASAQFVITRDGMPHQFVGSAKAAWTNGDVQSPRTDILWINEAVRKVRQGLANFNDYTIALEFINDSRNVITDLQIERAIQITKYYDATYHIPKNRGHHNRHADVNSVTRPNCPGKDFPLQEILQESGVDWQVLNP
jgi:murein DD-endopeptidase MepM/ murein hydrolase activator NlpD